jgi:hypothetical protein
VSAFAQIAAVAFGPLRTLLGTEPLTGTQLALCAAVAVLPAAGWWIVKNVRWQQ